MRIYKELLAQRSKHGISAVDLAPSTNKSRPCTVGNVPATCRALETDVACNNHGKGSAWIPCKHHDAYEVVHIDMPPLPRSACRIALKKTISISLAKGHRLNSPITFTIYQEVSF